LPAFGLTVLASGAVLLYCAVRDISIGDFFRGIVSGQSPAPGSGAATAPTGPSGPTGTPGGKPPAGPVGSAGKPTGLATIPGTNQQVQSRWLSIVGTITRTFGVTVSSGYRTAAHNAEVGGAPNSDHLTGNAVDFVGSPTALRRLYQWAIKAGFPYVEPWSQTGGSHVHISFARG